MQFGENEKEGERAREISAYLKNQSAKQNDSVDERRQLVERARMLAVQKELSRLKSPAREVVDSKTNPIKKVESGLINKGVKTLAGTAVPPVRAARAVGGVFKLMNQFRKGAKRIGMVTAILMLCVALLYDGGQFIFNFIPVAGNLFTIIIDVFAWLTFFVWFKIKGVNFASPKRLMTLCGAGLLELVPVLNDLPAWTGAVALLIFFSVIEDRTGLNPLSMLSGNPLKAVSTPALDKSA